MICDQIFVAAINFPASARLKSIYDVAMSMQGMCEPVRIDLPQRAVGIVPYHYIDCHGQTASLHERDGLKVMLLRCLH